MSVFTIFFVIVGCITAVGLILVGGGFAADRFLRAKGYRGPVNDHFDGVHFHNIGTAQKAQKEANESIRHPKILRWLFTREKDPWTYRQAEHAESVVPVARVEGSKLVATYINHATVLLQTEGVNILTDPVLADRVSPFSFIGPTRFQDAGIRLSDLPSIDLILLSHNHYDHLDLVSLKEIADRDSPKIFTHLGNSEFLASHGISGAIDFDWFDEKEVVSGISVVSVPSQHFSARALSDRNKTLWGGFVIRTPHGDIYFAGDTGYGPFIQKIREYFPNGFRFGLLPIGAFKPEWFMHEVHISPEEAFQMKEKLGVRQALAVHFGTFKLADDGQDEPEELLKELSKKKGDSSFVAFKNGGSIAID